jgi:hypothetical protein
VPMIEDFLFLFFEPSDTSQRAGRAFWERRHQRTVNVDPASSLQTSLAQRAALTEWAGLRGERFGDLKSIQQPTLVVNGARHHAADDQLLHPLPTHSGRTAGRLPVWHLYEGVDEAAAEALDGLYRRTLRTSDSGSDLAETDS